MTTNASGGNISIVWDHILDQVIGDQCGVPGMPIRHAMTGATTDLSVTGLFVAIGHTPNPRIFAG